jgi:hypothetical protein
MTIDASSSVAYSDQGSSNQPMIDAGGNYRIKYSCSH